MVKVTFMGAGSTVFAKNIIGDSMLSAALSDAHYALYDIDAKRLDESRLLLTNLNDSINQGKATITAHLGVENRREALKGANYVVNAIQVGGYDSAAIDFELPKKYGFIQTVADTLGIGGIFRGLRTIPVMLAFARDIEEVCPDAWFLNYTNPMAIVTGAMLRATGVKTVGLCHSVQVCAQSLLRGLDMLESVKNLQWKIAGINHQAWLLEITDGGRDLYPEIRKRSAKIRSESIAAGKSISVRHEIMRLFGYYVTESDKHHAEYYPYWIKKSHPELLDRFGLRHGTYLETMRRLEERWEKQRDDLVHNKGITHERTNEYGSLIMEAMETNVPTRIGGNVLNHGLIPNLPRKATVEVPCLIDRNGVQGTVVGELPEQLAALNRMDINPQLMTIEAALTRKKEAVYQAAMLDPHASSDLTLDEIRSLCDELFEAHAALLPHYD